MPPALVLFLFAVSLLFLCFFFLFFFLSFFLSVFLSFFLSFSQLFSFLFLLLLFLLFALQRRNQTSKQARFAAPPPTPPRHEICTSSPTLPSAKFSNQAKMPLLSIDRSSDRSIDPFIFLSVYLQFNIHKVLHLPPNLHFKVDKVLHLPPTLHFHIHKVLHLPRNLHFKVHKSPAPATKHEKTKKNQRKTSKLSRGPNPSDGDPSLIRPIPTIALLSTLFSILRGVEPRSTPGAIHPVMSRLPKGHIPELVQRLLQTMV